MTVDAMENVFPEDWPAVLANLRRAVRPGGHLYLTVEEVPETDLDDAFADLSARGLPVVRGEVIEGDVAGYHFYPGATRSPRGSRPRVSRSSNRRPRRLRSGATGTSSCGGLR